MNPEDLVAGVARDYPGAWTQYASFAASREELGGWPDWCYVPLAGAYAVVSGGRTATARQAQDVARVGAAAAWRARPLVWRGASATARPWGSVDLRRLPQWCTWVEPADGSEPGWIHLEHDANDRRTELRIALVIGGDVVGVPVHLDHRTLAGALDSAVAEVAARQAVHAPAVTGGWLWAIERWLPLAQELAARPDLAQPWRRS